MEEASSMFTTYPVEGFNMFKLDHQEFIAYRVGFQKRLTDLAEEIVEDCISIDDDINNIDKCDAFDQCFDRIVQEADRECIYTSDNYKLVQFFQQWDFEEVDQAEQRLEEICFIYKGLDDLMTQLAYTLWENQLVAAVQLRIDDLLTPDAEEAA